MAVVVNTLPPLATQVLDDYFKAGQKARKKGLNPRPPIRPDSCEAYWQGYQHPTRQERR